MQIVAHENATREGKITQLRALLAEKFPQPTVRPGGVLAVDTGSALPELRRGVVTEVSGSLGSGALFLETLVASAQTAGTLVALVDGASSFDPTPMGICLARLLWVLCKDASTALKTADLLLRDGNLPLVVLDLQMNSAKDLRRIPATTWYRFQRLLEPSAATFVVLTAHPMVSSAAERFELHNRWTLQTLQQRRTDLHLAVGCAHRRSLASIERQTA